MSEKPILFNGDMVRAILDGRKTMTRRIVKPQPHGTYDSACDHSAGFFDTGGNDWACEQCGWGIGPDGHSLFHAPYQVGDVLYVRETWCKLWQLDINDQIIDGTEKYYYAADGYNPTPFNRFPNEYGVNDGRDCPRWHPSIHMPRKAARIFLKVTDVRVERVQDIAEMDAMAEGVTSYWAEPHKDVPPFIGADLCSTRRKAYQQLWDDIYAKRGYGWEASPWVWVIEFERVGGDIHD